MSHVETWEGLPTDLVSVGELKTSRKNVPLMMEFSVNPETAPFLVTSTRDFVWVTPRKDRVRAATRVLGLPSFFMEVVREVARQGAEAEWGNVHPLTEGGIKACIEHLQFYGLLDMEMLVTSDVEIEAPPEMTVRVAPWLDSGYVVVLPRERAYVGFVLTVPSGLGLCVFHNPSRAIAVARKVV